ncbi:hypothetical protein R1A27_28360 [Methylobacterium sp. NMS12]|uniref:hypothetical protein n=1 Tax=Methylobacterium sp. NMS12 TaxID=3079766 RepID=UPI003F883329
MDGLLFDRAGMGGQGGFSGTSGTIVPPAVPAQPEPEAEAPAPRAMPTPPVRPLSFGSLPAPAAPAEPAPSPASPAPTTTGSVAPSAAASEPSLGDRFWGAIKANGDLMGSLGYGLLSTRGFGAGLAAGLKNYDDTQTKKAVSDLARAEYGLKVRKLNQEQAGNNATVDALVRKGVPAADAQAAIAAAMAGHSEALSNLLNNNFRKVEVPSGFQPTADGGLAPTVGGPQDLARKRAEAQATAEGSAAGKPTDDFNLSPGQTRYSGETNQPIAAAAPDKPQGFDTESKLRGEFAKGLGTFGDVHDGYGRVIAATRQREANPNGVSPASDIGLVFGYMKMLDPGSVVREGEYATAANAAGIPERVRNAYNKAMKGEFLTPEQRQDFVGQAAELYGTARKTAEGVAGRYRNLATQYGVDPDRAAYLPEMPVPPVVGRDKMRPGAGVAAPLDVGGARDMGGGITIRRTR